jgi:micrococcal nuclease
MKKFILFALVVLFTFSLAGCEDEPQTSNQDLLLAAKNGVEFTSMQISEDITLPEISTDGVVAKWTSNNEAVLSNEGVVNQPSFEEGDTKVFLTLTVTLGEDISTRLFEFTVLAADQAIEVVTLQEILDSITFESGDITDDLVMPTIDNDAVTAEWTTTSAALTTEGLVTRETYLGKDVDVLLTLKLTYGSYEVTEYFEFTVLKEEKPDFVELTTKYTDELTMDFEYENKNFISTGYGEVTLSRCVDGDTAIFSQDGTSFTVRFLGVDTPESTYRFDPWGKAASTFTCDKLTNASSIVLEKQLASDERTDGNGRYLAWVWYDGRLLNLELIEQAYSKSKSSVTSKYGMLIFTADLETQLSDRRVWGETDPDFDYSLDGTQITIEELVTNKELYLGKKVVIRGIVSRKIGGHPYLTDNGFSIYLYKGYEYTTKLEEGNEVLLSGLTLTYHPDQETGSPQLTGFSRSNIEVLSTGNVVDSELITIDAVTVDHLGGLYKIENLTVKSIYSNPDDNAFTVTAEDADGNTITIRRDAFAPDELTDDLFTIGTTFDIIGPLSRYNGKYQLMIAKIEDVTFK